MANGRGLNFNSLPIRTIVRKKKTGQVVDEKILFHRTKNPRVIPRGFFRRGLSFNKWHSIFVW